MALLSTIDKLLVIYKNAPGRHNQQTHASLVSGSLPDAPVIAEQVPELRRIMAAALQGVAESNGMKPDKEIPASYYLTIDTGEDTYRQISIGRKVSEGSLPRYTVKLLERFRTSIGPNSIGNKYEFHSIDDLREFVEYSKGSGDIRPVLHLVISSAK